MITKEQLDNLIVGQTIYEWTSWNNRLNEWRFLSFGSRKAKAIIKFQDVGSALSSFSSYDINDGLDGFYRSINATS